MISFSCHGFVFIEFQTELFTRKKQRVNKHVVNRLLKQCYWEDKMALIQYQHVQFSCNLETKHFSIGAVFCAIEFLMTCYRQNKKQNVMCKVETMRISDIYILYSLSVFAIVCSTKHGTIIFGTPCLQVSLNIYIHSFIHSQTLYIDILVKTERNKTLIDRCDN